MQIVNLIIYLTPGLCVKIVVIAGVLLVIFDREVYGGLAHLQRGVQQCLDIKNML